MKDMESGRYRIEIDLKPALSEEKIDARLVRELTASKGGRYIDILPAGIEMSGGTYLKFISAGTTKVSLDATGIIMDTAGKFVLNAKNGDNSSIVFGPSAANATFSVGDSSRRLLFQRTSQAETVSCGCSLAVQTQRTSISDLRR